MSRAVDQLEVEAGQVQRPASLAMVEFLSHHKVLQVLVVCPDLHWVLGSFQEMPSLFKYMDDSKHLLVMDLVVLFHWRQGFAVEGHQVPFLLSR